MKIYLYDLIMKRNLRFIIFEAKGEQASKCLIYFHCPTVTKKNANLWDEKTIVFIILSLDEARHIFVTKR